jgi:hypothetical protein
MRNFYLKTSLLIVALLFLLTQDASAGRKRQKALLPSAARTATVAVDIPGKNLDWCYIIVDVTDEADTPLLTTKIQVRTNGTAGDTWKTICTSGQWEVDGVGNEMYLCGISFAVSGSSGLHEQADTAPLGVDNRVQIVHGDGDSVTYQVDSICGEGL